MITQSDIKCATIAKRYAGALFDLAREQNSADFVENGLQEICDCIDSSQDLKSMLAHPAIELDKKKEIITNLFADKIDRKIMNFVYLLLEENRINLINSILNFYKDIKNQNQGVLLLTITSAVEIPEDMKASLVSKLSNKFSKQIVPDYIVDESIIAGLIIKSADNVIDESYKTKFENMKKHLV